MIKLKAMVTAIAVATAGIGVSRTYGQEPVEWNRKVTGLEVTPTPGAPDGTFDVRATWDIELHGGPSTTFLDLSTTVEVLLLQEGSTVPQPIAVDTIAIQIDPHGPSNPNGFEECLDCQADCTTASCGTSNDGQEVLTCKKDDECSGNPFMEDCVCSGIPPGGVCTNGSCPGVIGILAVPGLAPEDEIFIILYPAPGALPELPGFPDDDEMSSPPGNPCEDECPEDLNGDGVVNTEDLLQLLAGWGPCFPM